MSCFIIHLIIAKWESQSNWTEALVLQLWSSPFFTFFIVFVCHQCKCWPGFHLKDDGKTCVDVDECSTTLPCSQRCINTYGSYKCLCVDGYEALERNPNTCKALSGQPDFLSTCRNSVRPTGPLTLHIPHFSWRAFSHYGRPPWDPEAECGWLKLHHLETGKWYLHHCHCPWSEIFTG